jgi:hypothetical protein
MSGSHLYQEHTFSILFPDKQMFIQHCYTEICDPYISMKLNSEEEII